MNTKKFMAIYMCISILIQGFIALFAFKPLKWVSSRSGAEHGLLEASSGKIDAIPLPVGVE